MPDLTETGVLAWFTPLRPPDPKNTWPPAVRALERAQAVQPLLDTLGHTLAELEGEPLDSLRQVFGVDAVLRDLQMVLSQLGGARLLRMIDWLASSLPDADQIILQLSRGETAEGQAISSSIRALTGRASINRMFSPARAAELLSCTEATIENKENA